jgi:hypothetical protein
MVGTRAAELVTDRAASRRSQTGAAEMLSAFFESVGKVKAASSGSTVLHIDNGLSDAPLLNAARSRPRNSRGVLQPSALENTRLPENVPSQRLVIDKTHETSGLWAEDLILSPGTRATLQRAALLSREAPQQSSSSTAAASARTKQVAMPSSIEPPPSPPPEEDFMHASPEEHNTSTENNILIQTTSFTQTTIILSERKRKTTQARSAAASEADRHPVKLTSSARPASVFEDAAESEKEGASASLAVTIGDSSAPSLTGLSSPRYHSFPDSAEGALLLHASERAKEVINTTADISAILAAHSGLVRKYANASAIGYGSESKPPQNALENAMPGTVRSRPETQLLPLSPLPERDSARAVSAAWDPSPVILWEPRARQSRRKSRGPVTILAWKTRPQFPEALAALATPNGQVEASQALEEPEILRPSIGPEPRVPQPASQADAEPSRMPAALRSVPLRVPQSITLAGYHASVQREQRPYDHRSAAVATERLPFQSPIEAVYTKSTKEIPADISLADELDSLDMRDTPVDFPPEKASTGMPEKSTPSRDHPPRGHRHVAQRSGETTFPHEIPARPLGQFSESTNTSIADTRKGAYISSKSIPEPASEAAYGTAGFQRQRGPVLKPLSLASVDVGGSGRTREALPPRHQLPPRVPRDGNRSAAPEHQKKPLGYEYAAAQGRARAREAPTLRTAPDLARERPPLERARFVGRHRPATIPKTPHLETERRARLRADAARAAQAEVTRKHQVRGHGPANANYPAGRWRPRITVPQTPNVLRHGQLCRRERPKTREELDLEEMERGRQALLRMREANERSRRRCLRIQTCAVYGAAPVEHWPETSEYIHHLPSKHQQAVEQRRMRTVSLGPAESPEWDDKHLISEARRLTMPAWSETISSSAEAYGPPSHSFGDPKNRVPHSPTSLGLFRNIRR